MSLFSAPRFVLLPFRNGVRNSSIKPPLPKWGVHIPWGSIILAGIFSQSEVRMNEPLPKTQSPSQSAPPIVVYQVNL